MRFPWPTCGGQQNTALQKGRKNHDAQTQNQCEQGTAERRHRTVPERDPAGEDAHQAAGAAGEGNDPRPRQQRGIGVHHRGARGRCSL